MGDLPSRQNMVSSIIVSPEFGSRSLIENTTFQVSVRMINFVAGSFTNAQSTYYAVPQELSDGKVVGHTRELILCMNGVLSVVSGIGN